MRTLAVLLVPAVIAQPRVSPSKKPLLRVIEYAIPRPGNFPHDPAVAPDGGATGMDAGNAAYADGTLKP